MNRILGDLSAVQRIRIATATASKAKDRAKRARVEFEAAKKAHDEAIDAEARAWDALAKHVGAK